MGLVVLVIELYCRVFVDPVEEQPAIFASAIVVVAHLLCST